MSAADRLAKEVGTLILMTTLIASCGAPVVGPPSPSTIAGASAAVSPSPSVAMEASPAASPAASAAPSPSPSPSTLPAPSPTAAAATARQIEQDLQYRLRPDTKVACTPKRTGLPARAVAGIECQVGTSLVTVVGIYGFRSQEAALKTYIERLAQNGVRLRSGDCAAGKPGDSAWTPGDGEAGDVPFRIGCYRDDQGRANIRLTCWGGDRGGIYIGIVGTNSDLAALERWAWRFAKGNDGYAPSSPGICNDNNAANDPGPYPAFPGTM